MIGDIDYLKMICYGTHYVQFEFILSFVYLIAHMRHNEQMMSMKCASSSKGQLPFLQVITYERQRLVETDLLTVPQMYKKIVGVFHFGDHYAIAEIDHSKSWTITIFDNLFWDLLWWQKKLVQLLMKCRLIDLDTEAIKLIPDPSSKWIVPGHHHGNDMVNGFSIIINRVMWRLIRGAFLVQNDPYNCGPLACLKVMELFHLPKCAMNKQE